MCKGNSTVQSSSGPPQQFLDQYSNVTNLANQIAGYPYSQYPAGPNASRLVAPLTANQNAAIGSAGPSNPFIQQASGAIGSSTAPLLPQIPTYGNSAIAQNVAGGLGYAAAAPSVFGGVPTYSPEQIAQNAAGGLGTLVNSTQGFGQVPTWHGQGSVQPFLSPYIKDVVGATEAQFANTNAQQQQSLIGNAASQGAWGGDRSAVAQAVLGGQQQAAEAPVIAGLYNQGFGQAVGEFNTQQQTALQKAAQQAQAEQGVGNALVGFGGQQQALENQLAAERGQLMQGSANQLIGFGQGQQQTELGALEANAWLNSQAGFGLANLGQEGFGQQLTAGQLEQQQKQAQLNVPYEQWLARQAYPFQTTGWLANISEGLGGASGGSSSTTYPPPDPLSSLAGVGLGSAGVLGATGAFGSSGWLTGGGNAATNPYNAYPALDSLGAGQWTGAQGGRIPHRDMGGMVPYSPMGTSGSMTGFGTPMPGSPMMPMGGFGVPAAAPAAVPAGTGFAAPTMMPAMGFGVPGTMGGYVPSPQPTPQRSPIVSSFMNPAGGTSTTTPSAGSTISSDLGTAASLASIGKFLAPLFLQQGGIVHRDMGGAVPAAVRTYLSMAPRGLAHGGSADPELGAGEITSLALPDPEDVQATYDALPVDADALRGFASPLPGHRRAIGVEPTGAAGLAGLPGAQSGPRDPNGPWSFPSPRADALAAGLGVSPEPNRGDVTFGAGTPPQGFAGIPGQAGSPGGPTGQPSRGSGALAATAPPLATTGPDVPHNDALPGMGTSPVGLAGASGGAGTQSGPSVRDPRVAPRGLGAPPPGSEPTFATMAPDQGLGRTPTTLAPPSSIAAPSGAGGFGNEGEGETGRASTEDRADARRRQNMWLALAAAGFGMAAGRSPFAAANIGQGGLEGVKFYGQLQEQEQKREDTLAQREETRAYRESNLFETKRYHDMTDQQRGDALADHVQRHADQQSDFAIKQAQLAQEAAQREKDRQAAQQLREQESHQAQLIGTEPASGRPVFTDKTGRTWVGETQIGPKPGEQARLDQGAQRIDLLRSGQANLVDYRNYLRGHYGDEYAERVRSDNLRALTQFALTHPGASDKDAEAWLTRYGAPPSGAPPYGAPQVASPQGAANPGIPPPQLGQVQNGFRYQGGDPKDRNSWAPVQ